MNMFLFVLLIYNIIVIVDGEKREKLIEKRRGVLNIHKWYPLLMYRRKLVFFYRFYLDH